MSDSSEDHSGFWISFVCMFVFFGTNLTLTAVEYGKNIQSPIAVITVALLCLIATSAISFYGARRGEDYPSAPGNSFEFWIRFICAFLVFGVLACFVMMRVFSSIGSPAVGVASWFLTTTSSSVYAARHGDSAWVKIINFIRFW